MRQGGPYPQGWWRTPAGCSTQGCRTSCRTHTHWLPARSRDADHGSHLLQPGQTPPATPKTPRGAQSLQHNDPTETGMSLPNCKAAGRADSIWGAQDPSGPDASLTIKAGKTPLGALEKWGHVLTTGKQSVSLPSDCEKGLETDKRH